MEDGQNLCSHRTGGRESLLLDALIQTLVRTLKELVDVKCAGRHAELQRQSIVLISTV